MIMHEFKRAPRPTETDGEIVAEALDGLSRAVHRLGTGNASTPLGAIEALANEVHDGYEAVSAALNNVATSLDHIAEAIRVRDE